MADRDRLRPLQVRVAGQRRLRLGTCELEQHCRERDERVVRLGARVRDVEPERGGDLVVAGAAGVDLAAERPEQALDRGVDVLVGLLDDAVGGDRAQRQPHVVELLGREDARGREPLGMERRRLAVVRQELRVVGAEELPDGWMRARRRLSRPTRFSRWTASRDRDLPLARRRQLGLERADGDEALGRGVRERLARAVRRQRLGVERELASAAR